MKTIKSYCKTPIGPIEIICTNSKIFSISSVKRLKSSSDNKLSLKIKKSLKDYFNGDCSALQNFSLNLFCLDQGTDFQKKVWKELKKIKHPNISSYKDLAIKVKSPKSSRAIGGAVGKNPFLLFFPCHRVLGSNKKITGFSAGINKKIFLLKHEDLEFIP